MILPFTDLIRRPTTRHSGVRVALPALALLASGATLALRDTPSLAAAEDYFGGRLYVDADGDGIPDAQEEVLGTSPDRVDTDGDTFSDLEEVARQTDPLDLLHFPMADDPKIGLTGRVEGGALTSFSAAYVEGGALLDLHFQFGLVVGSLPVYFPVQAYLSATRVNSFPAANPLDQIVVIETLLPDSLVHNLGGLTICVKHMGDAVSGQQSAAALDLLSFSGTTVSILAAPPDIRGGEGLVFRPLCLAEEVPPDWTPGQLCWQRTATVGVSGVQLIQEVEDAGCEQMDTYCSPSDCAATIGDTISITDPGSLIGG
jgi:hypothetical protein